MEKEKISIIVAIYKSEPFLVKLLDSIINQSYRNLEIILVDDGSPDNSGEICDEYAKKDDRIIVIHKENGGACEARNYGLEKATGEYVSIIDGDDWLETDYIEYLYNLVSTTDSEMSMTDQIFTTRDRKQIKNDKIEIWSSEKAASEIIYPTIPIGPWNKLIKKSVITNNNISFSVPWSGEGLYFTFMCAQYANKVVVGHRKVYNYRLNNAGSGLTNYNVQMGINALWNIKNIKKNILNDSVVIGRAVNWHIWKNHVFLLKLIIATDSKEKYNKEYYECLKYIKKNKVSVALTSDIGIKGKIKTVIIGLFPIIYIKKSIKKERDSLKKDLMK